jgi:hypothetical protein
MQFVRRDAGHYYLHQVDRDYALDRIPDGQPSDRDTDPPPFTQYALRHRAADYFSQTETPRQDWKTLDDLAPQLAEFELRYQGEDYESAAQVLLNIDSDYLMQWGHYRYVLDLHTRLHPHLTDPWTTDASLTRLGYCQTWATTTRRSSGINKRSPLPRRSVTASAKPRLCGASASATSAWVRTRGRLSCMSRR